MSVADIYSLSRVCKGFEKYGCRKELSEKLNKIIESRLLEIFGHRLSDFYSVLEKNGKCYIWRFPITMYSKQEMGICRLKYLCTVKRLRKGDRKAQPTN